MSVRKRKGEKKMKVNDTRVKHNAVVLFKELKVGQAYEDKEGILCIKTHRDDDQDNCICFIEEQWEPTFEIPDTKVTPLTTTLEIER
jgi:hypothetical protein